ncbi:LiPocalin-Related protein [Ditylenchus destructor]|uniref:LiPocalin-Related protein n=1 Tax=Ditylenchus destructor TaxID=166010 RepID=A0AAD4NEH4_9BILA|nr:LiPocalin-Related protein [Ditylenchus destructor]
MITGIGQMLQNPMETIDVPSQLIMGRWFQVYKAAVNFDVYRTQMYCPVAYFKPNRIMGEDGFSMEEAYRVHSKHGPFETFKRDLNKVGSGKYWMYTEEYFYPKQFYIIKAGPKFDNETSVENADIQYLVVTDGSRLALQVYARDPMVFYQKYNKEMNNYLEESGYGGKVFWNSPRPIYQGPDCEWPSEKEVFARRVLKNHETNQRAANSTEMPATALADMLKNPQMALQKLVQMH